jgi:membrane protein involved in colicin uptake
MKAEKDLLSTIGRALSQAAGLKKTGANIGAAITRLEQAGSVVRERIRLVERLDAEAEAKAKADAEAKAKADAEAKAKADAETSSAPKEGAGA